jgi:hypothetical protein
METDKRDLEKIAKYVNRCLRFILGIWWPNVISNEDLRVRTKQKEIWEEIRYQKWKRIGHILRQERKYSKESLRGEPARRKKRRKTQDYMAKHSEDGSRTSREEMAGNTSSEQERDPMASFHKGPMPLRGVKGQLSYSLKRLLYSAGFEPANYGSNGKHATTRPPRATKLKNKYAYKIKKN